MKNGMAAGIGIIVLGTAISALTEEPALTIYNQNFAVVREKINLDLKEPVNSVQFNEITATLEPDSVVLRDPTGKQRLQILEQNYRADPVSEGLLLSLFEGQIIEFLTPTNSILRGKIVRSGYQSGQPHTFSQPVIEVDGKLRFSLPGLPLFPSLTNDVILKPTLNWLLASDAKGKLNAELSYITGGLRWQAAYNLVAPEKGDLLTLIGWVTVENNSGRTFNEARIKLMAGDVNKVQERSIMERGKAMAYDAVNGAAPVSEKTFDEYHLYTLSRLTTLHERETKQVEFVRADGVKFQRLYIYDGAQIDQRYRGWDPNSIRQNPDYGTQCNPKVAVMCEFQNSETNRLGLPLPKGRVRFYRRDNDGQLEFTGENEIDHTPKDEKIRLYTGNSFDLAGERRRTNYQLDTAHNMCDESFEIKLRNHKKEAVEIRVVEHLYRWFTWEIATASSLYEKTDARTIEFRVPLKPDEEKTIAYQAHYSW